MYTYQTKGTCSKQIDIELDGNIIKHVNSTVAVTETCRRSQNW